MDTSLARHKPRRLDTSPFSGSLASVIALSPNGSHLAVGCGNGDVLIWRLPLGEDTAATHRVSIQDVTDADVLSAAWASDALVMLGRKNGLVAVIHFDYVSPRVPVSFNPYFYSRRMRE